MKPQAANETTKGRGRRRAVRTLVAIGAVLTFLAIFSVWVERQLLDTDDWVQTSAELIEEEEIRAALADYLLDELYTYVDMEQEIEEILPDPLKGLAGPAAGGLRQGAGEATEILLDSGSAKTLWAGANRAAHSELVAVLDGRDDYVLTDEGVVTLDLGEMLRDFADQVGVGGEIATEIPDDAARVEILRSDELETAQDIARAIRGLAILLTALSIISFGTAIAVARGQRWVALLGTAVGIAAAAFLVLVIRRVAGSIMIDQLVTDPSVTPTAEAAWSVGTGLLAGIAVSLIVFAAALGAAAWLASTAPSARAARGFLAPGLRDHIAIFYTGLAVVFGGFFLIGGAQSIRSILTVLAVAGLALVGLRELRRMTAVEFPEAAAWAGVGEMRERMGVAVRRLRSSSDEPVRRRATAPIGVSGRIEELERLAALHERGVLSDEELAAEKSRILGEPEDLP